MTTTAHHPASNGIHRCPFPETGCTARTCHGITRLSLAALSPAAVHAAVRQIAGRIHLEPRGDSLAVLLESAVKPNVEPAPFLTRAERLADMNAALTRLRDEPPAYQPTTYYVHPGAYDDAAAGRCTCRWSPGAWPFPCNTHDLDAPAESRAPL